MLNSPTELKHVKLTEKVIGNLYEVYNELGHGFIESVYEKSLAIALLANGHEVAQQVDIPVWFRGNQVGDFHADLLVERTLILELKSARAMDASHVAQLMNYLRATDIEVELLLNFGPKPEFRRLVFDNARKQTSREKGILDSLFE